jgi:pimeloyl-ACP methyl ester carboxylesterase
LYITLDDSRALAYTDIGDPGWPTAIFFHGAPMTRLHLSYLEEQFLAQRVRVISPDLPGYGRSSPLPGRSLADWPADVGALADALPRAADEAAAIAWCTEKFGADGSGFHSASDFAFAEPDNALSADEQADPAIAAAANEAFRQGVAGYAQDAFVQSGPWSFDVRAIAAPARIIHGELDTAVPLAHGEHTVRAAWAWAHDDPVRAPAMISDLSRRSA